MERFLHRHKDRITKYLARLRRNQIEEKRSKTLQSRKGDDGFSEAHLGGVMERFTSAQGPNRGKYIRVRSDAIYWDLAMDGARGWDGKVSQ